MDNSPLLKTLHIKTAEIAQSSWKDTALVILALVYSGNPALGRALPSEPQLVLLALFFAVLLVLRTQRALSMDFVIVAMIFAGILLSQCIDFSFYPVVTMSGFFVRLFIGYALVRVVNNFPRTFVRTMIGLAWFSFAFYIPSALLSLAGVDVFNWAARLSTILGTSIPSRDGYGVSYYPLVFHTFNTGSFLRNSGMFWEPGAFQGYLILALIFLALIKKKISLEQYLRYLFILVAAVISTLSTTGYVALAFVPILHYDLQVRNRRQMMVRTFFLIFIISPLLILGSVYAYKSLPFLSEKIDHQLHVVQSRDGRWHRSRIGSILFDWEYMKRRPLTGWGLHGKTRYALHPGMDDSEGMGNGFSAFIASMGIIGFAAWLIPVYLGFKGLAGGNSLTAIFICTIILVLLQGEAFLNFPMFRGLAFLVPLNALPYYCLKFSESYSTKIALIFSTKKNYQC